MAEEHRRDFSTAARVRNLATGTVYVRIPGTDTWRADHPIWGDKTVTTSQLEALPEMEPCPHDNQTRLGILGGAGPEGRLKIDHSGDLALIDHTAETALTRCTDCGAVLAATTLYDRLHRATWTGAHPLGEDPYEGEPSFRQQVADMTLPERRDPIDAMEDQFDPEEDR